MPHTRLLKVIGLLLLFILPGGPVQAINAVNTATTQLISVGPGGLQGNQDSLNPHLSQDGRYLAFASMAKNLAGGMGESEGVFLADLSGGTLTHLVLGYSSGMYYPTDLSADGRFTVVTGPQPGSLAQQVLVYDRQTGQVVRASVKADGTAADNSSFDGSISADGRYVVYASAATDLVSEDMNGFQDVFLYNRDVTSSGVFDTPGNTRTTRISVALNGAQGNGDSGNPVITPDGRYIAFWTQASTLFPGDANSSPDVLVYDRDSDHNGTFDEPGKVSLARVSISTDGTQSGGGFHNLDISADGRFVAFTASGWNGHDCAFGSNYYLCSDIYVHDLLAGETTLVSQGWDGAATHGRTFHPSISADGRFISFYGEAEADNLVPGTVSGRADVYVYDRQTSLTMRISNGAGSVPGNGDSMAPSLSGDGRYVAYQSLASNLVFGDANGYQDIFITDASLNRPETTRTDVLPDAGGSLADAPGGFNLLFPPNAVEGPVTVSYTTPIWLIHPLADGERAVRVFRLEAVSSEGTPVTHFLAPYVMQIDFTPVQLAALAVSANTLRLVYWDGAAWQTVPSSLDTTHHSMTAAADHFSQFALVGATHSLFLPRLLH